MWKCSCAQASQRYAHSARFGLLPLIHSVPDRTSAGATRWSRRCGPGLPGKRRSFACSSMRPLSDHIHSVRFHCVIFSCFRVSVTAKTGLWFTTSHFLGMFSYSLKHLIVPLMNSDSPNCVRCRASAIIRPRSSMRSSIIPIFGKKSTPVLKQQSIHQPSIHLHPAVSSGQTG